MKILCVEDGSVDIEKLEEDGLKDGGVLVYRQNANQPYILDFGEKDNNTIYKELFLYSSKLIGDAIINLSSEYQGGCSNAYNTLVKIGLDINKKFTELFELNVK